MAERSIKRGTPNGLVPKQMTSLKFKIEVKKLRLPESALAYGQK